MSENKELLTTGQKALTVNLGPPVYGTFAEIGAGQEVAREFVLAGAASGTIAKSISAYDMVFSDAIYGKAPRYVSRERLRLMLDHEYELLMERLSGTRGECTNFFVFADTVATINFKGTNEAHGWMGIRFQPTAGATPSEIVLHVRMRDSDAALDIYSAWEAMVPASVAQAIKDRRLFGSMHDPYIRTETRAPG